jgi:conjugative relaxase-like TrwC/TraI family protein
VGGPQRETILLGISTALSSSQCRSYYRSEFSSAALSYYSQDDELKGQWAGTLAKEMGLVGPVNDAMYDRLADGKDPFNGEQLIGHRRSKDGSMEHRAGWDLVFSPGKTISLTALPGGDERIRVWHREALAEALSVLETHIQGRAGGNNPAVNTGKAIFAMFEHDSARPVDGYSAPLLHTHCILFNLTALDANGKPHAIQEKEIFNLQALGTRIYQNALSYRLLRAGYELEPGENHSQEIRGYSQEYIDAESARNRIIRDELEKRGVRGSKAASIVARESREEKLEISSDELRAMHAARAVEFGDQAAKVVATAKERALTVVFEKEATPKEAVDFAIKRLSEREAVIERDGYRQRGGIYQSALEFRPGHHTLDSIKTEVEKRTKLSAEEIAAGHAHPQLVLVTHYRPNAPGKRYTTRKMLSLEREMIEHVLDRRGKYREIANLPSKDEFRATHRARLNDNQLYMVWNALHSTDQIIGVQGAAGVGKTTTMGTLAEIGRDYGYTVRGLSPISGAAAELSSVGIKSETLAAHNRRLQAKQEGEYIGRQPESERLLYLFDETSLTGTKATHYFFKHLEPTDRVLIIGDQRQHDSIEAGRAFAQLQSAGMQTFALSKILRQRPNPELLKAVIHFHNGHVRAGLHQLEEMGAIVETQSRHARYRRIAAHFTTDPLNTIIVSPDNRSRQEINVAVREILRSQGMIQAKQTASYVLVARPEITEADKRRALSYQVGDWIKTNKSAKALGIESGEYFQVISRSAETNTVSLKRRDGKIFDVALRQYDLKASVYQMEERVFSVGERIQFTSQYKKAAVSNRTLGTIDKLDEHGNAIIRLDAKKGQAFGRQIALNLRTFGHLDYGYTMTSYSMQGKTKHTVIANIEAGDSRGRALLDKKMIYVMSSRASHEFVLYTDSKQDLEHALSRLEPKSTALSKEQTADYKRRLVSRSQEVA